MGRKGACDEIEASGTVVLYLYRQCNRSHNATLVAEAAPQLRVTGPAAPPKLPGCGNSSFKVSNSQENMEAPD